MNNIKIYPSMNVADAVHTKIETHFCEICGRSFPSQYKYKRHLELHKDFNLQCLHCPKLFNRRVQLLNHLFMHSKLKPYHCATCNYANDRKGNVADHVKKVHKKEWTNEDIMVDKEELALMRKICHREADIIQGYTDRYKPGVPGQTKQDHLPEHKYEVPPGPPGPVPEMAPPAHQPVPNSVQ